jgi:hypothetical protein
LALGVQFLNRPGGGKPRGGGIVGQALWKITVEQL